MLFVIRRNMEIYSAYAVSIRDGDAREYDSSRLASQKQRKTWMRRAVIDRRNPARESGARSLFWLPKSVGESRKHSK